MEGRRGSFITQSNSSICEGREVQVVHVAGEHGVDEKSKWVKLDRGEEPGYRGSSSTAPVSLTCCNHRATVNVGRNLVGLRSVYL